MNQCDIEALEDEEVEDMHYYPHPNAGILRCPNPVITRNPSHEFMVTGDYYPDLDTEYDGEIFRLFPNTTMEYECLVHGQGFVYHQVLNNVKVDKHKRPVKKFQIRQ
jgi:hypothetical protein